MKYWKFVFTIVRKDLQIEFRSKEIVTAMLIFGLMIIVVFSFAFSMGEQQQLGIAPGLLWVAFTFAGVLGLNQTFSAEQENNCIHGIMVSPIPRSVIYVGKLISNSLLMLASECIILLVFIVFFDVSFAGKWLHLFAVLLLGTVGFAATGTIFSAVSSGARMRTFLLPILQFPIVVPLVIAAVEATASLMNGDDLNAYYDWLNLLLVFNVIFITVSVLLFEYILEE